MQKKKTRLPYRNPVLADGLLAAPLAAFCDSFDRSLAGAFVFVCVMLITVLLTAVIPKKLSLSLRILFYSVTAALVYIPTVLIAATLIPVSGGIWLPVIAAVPALTVYRDRYFGGRGMFRNLLRTLISVPLIMLLFGAVREMLGSGMLSGKTVLTHPPLPILCTPAGGLLMLCCVCIGAVYLPNRIGKEAEPHAAR